MNIADQMPLVSLVWIWVPLLFGFYFVRRVRKIEGSGLVTAYLVNFCGLYWAAGLIRLLPWFKPNEVFTTYGVEQSTYALAALIAGSLFLSPLIISHLPAYRAGVQYTPHPRLPQAYMLIGVVSYILLSTFLSRLPSITVVIATGQGFFVVGLCLLCWNSIRRKQVGVLLGGIALAMTLPLITIFTQAFLGLGAAAALVVFAFIGCFFSRWKMFAVAVLACYLGLSVYVTYMRDRKEIRGVIWSGQPLENRMDRIRQTVSAFEWFDPSNVAHLRRIDSRMNQDWLVGAAVSRLSGSQQFAGGATLWDAVLALVPRALWPNKSVFAGSGDLVSRYTGMRFVAGTSVGVGQVLEFYINFGTIGVVLGFLALGAIITTFDGMARRRLLIGDHQGFVLWFLTGMSLLQAGGSLVEISASAAGGILVATMVNRYLVAHLQKKHFLPAAPMPTFVAPRLKA